MFEKIRKIHFVGIGGSGMCGIAEVLLNLGYDISGSDLSENENVRRLLSLGAKISIGHSADNLGDPHVVVISSAVQSDNVEVVFAKSNNIPVIRRAEMLAELMRLKYALCVAGTHGKTTTTSMIGLILSSASMDPTVVIGGLFRNLGSNVQLGTGDFMVVEADESDGSFMHFSPAISIVTNIDDDHMEYYHNMENLKSTFVQFINKVPFYGYAILCGDDLNIQSILGKLTGNYKTYGLNENNHYSARKVCLGVEKSTYELYKAETKIGNIEIYSSGMHNVTNSLAACAAALEMGIEFSVIKDALAQYKGVGRRLEKVGSYESLVVYDDYAHHPTAIGLSIKSLKKIYPDKKIVVVFQPHRYTRTRDLYKEFSLSLENADKIYITDIYAAGEDAIDGINSQIIINEFRDKTKIEYCPDFETVLEKLQDDSELSKICLTLGAGNVYKIGEDLLDQLNAVKT